ncbi:hypothetical protein L1887_45890 [Cichorium endivia]|nr:hypothetical protein L1887_45890 [Cichorium endivia]
MSHIPVTYHKLRISALESPQKQVRLSPFPSPPCPDRSLLHPPPLPPQPLLQLSPDSLQYEQGKVGAVRDGSVSESSVCVMEYRTNILTSKGLCRRGGVATATRVEAVGKVVGFGHLLLRHLEASISS